MVAVTYLLTYATLATKRSNRPIASDGGSADNLLLMFEPPPSIQI